MTTRNYDATVRCDATANYAIAEGRVRAGAPRPLLSRPIASASIDAASALHDFPRHTSLQEALDNASK